jgi:hypothetical protein
MSFLSMLGLVLIAPHLIAFTALTTRAKQATIWLKEIIVISFRNHATS